VERRRLGDSDLQVSEIGLGAWLTYAGGIEREQTEACTRAAFDAGINFFDTANAYGRGAAETAWGEILSEYPRDSYVLATKVFFPMSDADEDRGLSAGQIAKQLDASLQRLQTDYVDLYQCHRFDSETPIEETMEALSGAVRSGKVRYLGFSEWTVEQIEAGLAVPNTIKFVSSQPQYSMLWQAPEAELLEVCEQRGISQVVWSPLAQGVLTGKYAPGEPPPAGTRAASEQMGSFIRGRLDGDETLEAVQRLKPIAQDAGLSMVQLALAWVLRQPNVASAIIGASRPSQVHDNAAAAGVSLSSDTLQAIDAALGSVPVTGPTLAPGASAAISRRS
jgi:aryl-alcohol dehydrogenase-like predicted oxidoreductase